MHRSIPVVVVFVVLAATASLATADVRVSTILGNEAEVSIAVNPIDPMNQVICGHAPSPFETMNTFWTKDGGQTWTHVPIGPAEDGLPAGLRFDPTVAFAGDGNVYVAYGAGAGSGRDLVCARSTDGGESYDRFTIVVANDSSLDKWIVNTGPDSNTPGQFNVYLAYRVDSFPTNVRLASSYDEGETFPVDRAINDGGTLNTFGMAAVGPNGEVYVVWDDQSVSPTFSSIRVDRSFNDGVTFGTDLFVGTTMVARGNSNRYDILAQPDRGVLAVPSIAVDRSGGPYEGRVYVAYTVVGTGGFDDTDVIVRYSDDQASTWSPEIPVHSPDTNSQFLPWLDVDQATGAVAVAWLDARADGANEQVHAWIGLSVDGGDSFYEEQVADSPSDQSTSNPFRWSNNYLEYIGVAMHDGTAYAVWPDNRLDLGDLDYYTDSLTLGVLLCQAPDSPDADVLRVNGSLGPIAYLPAFGPHEFSIERPTAGGNGKFVVHLNDGAPDASTITPTPGGLGMACFDFIVPPMGTGSPVSIWNNLGKEARIGSSNYFGNVIADPSRATTMFHFDANGDLANLPLGSQWTLQGAILNPASSGSKPASLTNPVHIVVH